MCARCLIVDDSREYARVASRLLEQAGLIMVGAASTGAQAGQACSDLHPDVVLVDVNLGDESGLEVAHDLLADGGPDRPCVILISADSEEDFAEMVADTPGMSFLAKDALSGPAVLSVLAGTRRPAERRHRDSR